MAIKIQGYCNLFFLEQQTSLERSLLTWIPTAKSISNRYRRIHLLPMSLFIYKHCHPYLQPGDEVRAGGAFAAAGSQRMHFEADEVVFGDVLGAGLLKSRREQHRNPVQILQQKGRTGAFYFHCAK
mgnify:FL=1